MAIDTRQKRMSVFQVPGLMTPPFPDGSITRPDRQQMSEVYAGILAAVSPFLPNQTCWIPEVKVVDNLWVPEIEIPPCDD